MRTKWFLSLVLVGTTSVFAGGYTNDFSSYSTVTDLGDGTTIASSDGQAQVWNGKLRLTQDTSSYDGQVGNFALYDLDPGQAITGFTVSFDSLIKATSTSADGFSLNFGTLPSSLPNGGEQGMTSSSLLTIAWDTYGPNTGINVYLNGSSSALAHNAYSPIVEDNFNDPLTSASIVWDSESGLDVVYNGQTIFSGLDVSGFSATEGDCFAFAARTGASYEDVFIDNLEVATVPEPVSALLLGMTSLLLIGWRRLFSH